MAGGKGALRQRDDPRAQARIEERGDQRQPVAEDVAPGALGDLWVGRGGAEISHRVENDRAGCGRGGATLGSRAPPGPERSRAMLAGVWRGWLTAIQAAQDTSSPRKRS